MLVIVYSYAVQASPCLKIELSRAFTFAMAFKT
jgi:hypothetical protein